MDDIELKSILDSEIANATSATGTEDELANVLEKALKYYLGEPFGNEIENRSQVILTVVRDTIDWMLAELMKIFEGSDEVIRFDATSKADKDQADLESDVVTHVYEKMNNGFLITYQWFKDALMQRNGIVKTYYSEEVTEKRMQFVNQTDMELAHIQQNEDMEIVEHSAVSVLDPNTGMLITLHNVTVMAQETEGRVIVENVPPEEFLISSDANSLFTDQADFRAHYTQKTKSQLVAEGFDPEQVMPLGLSDNEVNNDSVAITRDNLNSGYVHFDDYDTIDESRQLVDVYECFLMVDYDDDGVSELRKITYAGKQILLNEEVDEDPFSAICPNPLPHKFYGLSVADDTMDLQLIESIILRNILDNLYSANNQRTVVNENVNLDDLLTSRPNGIIRTSGIPGQDVMPYPHTPIITEGLGMIDYLDQVKETRTGVGKTFQGQSDGIVSDTAYGTERVMTASEKKVDLIARIFAETGVRDMFLKIRSSLHKHGQVSGYFLNGEDVQVDPTTWKDRKTATIKVGLGTGDKTKQQQIMSQVLISQEKMIQQGLMGKTLMPMNIYKANVDMGKIGGLPLIEDYFTDPATIPPPPAPPEDPMIKLAMMQLQLENAKLQQETADDERKDQLKMLEMHLKKEIEMAKIAQQDIEDKRKNTGNLTKMELEYSQNVPGALV